MSAAYWGSFHTKGSIPQFRENSRSNESPSSVAEKLSMDNVSARPASRLAPPRRSLRADDPQRANRAGRHREALVEARYSSLFLGGQTGKRIAPADGAAWL